MTRQLGDWLRCDRCKRVYAMQRCDDCDQLHDVLRFTHNTSIVVDDVTPFCTACIEPVEAFVMEARELDIEAGRANN